MEKYDAIYGRQSVDRLDSISIESQIEYCQYETRGGTYKVFSDKGYSGKNTDRPQFQSMMDAIRRGEVNRVIVYRLDRISRSVLDFMNLFNEFQKYNVEFVSCTEKFDTSSPMGRAMLKIIVVFAELERETIQQRVCDAYTSRSRRGFYMGGKIPYGYRLEPFEIDGKKTARYVIDRKQAEVVKLIFEMYSDPQTSFGDIVKYLSERGIPNDRTNDGKWNRNRLADMIKNPVYVQADLDLYKFYKDQGSVLHDHPEDYVGHFGCYLYSDKNAGRKQTHLAGQHVVLAPHEGIVPSSIWIRARRKCLANQQVAKPLKAKNTWLAGKIKCGKCGYALTVKKARTEAGKYLICSHRLNDHACEGVGGLHAVEVEKIVCHEMITHLEQFFKVLHASQEAPTDPTRHELLLKIESLSSEIEQLVANSAEADGALFGYINKRVGELDSQLKEYQRRLDEIDVRNDRQIPDVAEITGYMDRWDDLSFEDKRAVVDQLIYSIRATETSCEIAWKI